MIRGIWMITLHQMTIVALLSIPSWYLIKNHCLLTWEIGLIKSLLLKKDRPLETLIILRGTKVWENRASKWIELNLNH